jgi:hypothetical protein
MASIHSLAWREAAPCIDESSDPDPDSDSDSDSACRAALSRRSVLERDLAALVRHREAGLRAYAAIFGPW